LSSSVVTTNSISPGFIETSLTFKNNTQSTIGEILNNIPLNRLGQPIEIAEFAHFLLSEKNTFLTGQDIIIDGGYLAGGFQK
jgi:3-oxoacyl-[acyl-carrier protein] reductase